MVEDVTWIVEPHELLGARNMLLALVIISVFGEFIPTSCINGLTTIPLYNFLTWFDFSAFGKTKRCNYFSFTEYDQYYLRSATPAIG